MNEDERKTEHLKERANTLFSMYERKATSFRRSFASVAVLMIIVFGLVFWPYVSFRGAELALGAQLASTQQALTGSTADKSRFDSEVAYFGTARVEAVSAMQDALQKLGNEEREHSRRINRVAEILKDEKDAQSWLSGEVPAPQLSASVLDVMLRNFPEAKTSGENDCFWLREDAWRHCKVAQALQSPAFQLPQYEYRRISHLRNELGQPFRESFNAIRQAFSAWLIGKADSWNEEYDVANGDTIAEFVAYADRLHRMIIEHYEDLRQQGYEKEKQIEGLQANLQLIESRLNEIRARIVEIAELEDINTPFGRLPIGVADLVLLFPVLLALGFAHTTTALHNVSKLRAAYHNTRLALNTEAADTQYLLLVAPVFIDPVMQRRDRVIRGLVFTSPALIFVVSLVLLAASRIFWGDFIGEVRLPAWTYYVLYLVSAAFVIESIRRVIQLIRAEYAR